MKQAFSCILFERGLSINPGCRIFLWQILVLALLLTGCSNTDDYELDLMPAPDIYSELNLDPFSDIKPARDIPYGGILYATDREPVSGPDKEEFYENKRGHLLRLGIGVVKFGEGQFSWEEAKKISLLKNRGKDYPLRVSEVNEFGVLDSSRSKLFDDEQARSTKSADRSFAAAVNKKLAGSGTKDVYIYVHGYRVVFTNPLLVATELWHFLGYDGAFIAYAWPATPNRLAYARDLETAAYSSRNLRLLIEYLAINTNAKRIHLVAYSAGTRLAIDALAQLALLNAGKEGSQDIRKIRIGNVVLLGSDFDRDIFAGYLEDGLLSVMEKLTIYMSGTDKALRVSKFLFTRQRLGQVFATRELTTEVQDYLRRSPQLVVIDVTNAENAAAGKGHDYFRRSPWVSSDVLMILKHNLAPQDRGIVRDEILPIWVFPDNYVDKLRQSLKQALGNM